MSRCEAVPETPSLRSSILGDTLTCFPARNFWRSITVNLPTPLVTGIRSAALAAKYDASESSDAPPGLYALNAIWSALKSVGFSNTRTPFDSFHSVTPTSLISRSDTTLPPTGSLSTSCWDRAFSAYAVMSARFTASNAARSSPEVGLTIPGLSGDVVTRTRFLSVIHSPASEFTSASVIPGSSLVTASRSYSMLVDGSDSRNAET